MESKEVYENIRLLSLSVGDFIRYWGFRRIHGAIWTQVYISAVGLSCSDLAKRLKLSKALISPALTELKKWELITEIPAPDAKIKLYTANENVEQVILKVLKNREEKMISRVSQNLEKLSRAKINSQIISESRIASLESMVSSAEFFLKFILSTENILTHNPLEK